MAPASTHTNTLDFLKASLLSDDKTTVAELRELVRAFAAARKWEPYHTPKNLAMALAVEAAELMEHFQWTTPEEAAAILADPQQVAAVGEEVADVLAYVLAMADTLGLDLSEALRAKMVKNAVKYPAPDA